MTIDDFRESGIDPELVQRIVLVEMDDSWCECEGLALKSCVIDNSVVPIAETGEMLALKRNPGT